MKSPSVTVVINTLNEAANLPACLQSVAWAAEIVVVDMHSSDATREIATHFGARVLLHEPAQYVEPARNFAIAQAQHEWVLVLDADERASEGLRAWIENQLEAAGKNANAFALPRRNYYGDVWVRCCGWFPDEQIRLYRKNCVSYSSRIHRAPEIQGAMATLPLEGDAHLIHRAFPDLTSRFDKQNRYALIAARALLEEGKRINGCGLLMRTVHSFIAAYFFQRGFRYGALGVMLSLERACATFLKYAKLWELQRAEQLLQNETPPSP